MLPIFDVQTYCRHQYVQQRTQAGACTKMIDERKGDHALDCADGGGRITLHNQIVTLLYDFATEVGRRAKKDRIIPQWSRSLTGGTQTRGENAKLDLVILAYCEFAEEIIDVVITNAAAPTHRAKGAMNVHDVLDEAYEDKHKRYNQGNGNSEIRLQVFALEMGGAMHYEAQSLLYRLAKSNNADDEEASKITNRWAKRIASVLAIGAADILKEGGAKAVNLIQDGTLDAKAHKNRSGEMTLTLQ